MKFVAFAAYFSDEISYFLAIMRCPWDILCVLLHIFRVRYPDEISCFFGSLRALRMRVHTCLAVMRLLENFMLFGCRIFVLYVQVAWFCMCKLGGSLAGGVRVSWVVVGESASALGDRRVCLEVV
jgi:hypothetical protein